MRGNVFRVTFTDVSTRTGWPRYILFECDRQLEALVSNLQHGGFYVGEELVHRWMPGDIFVVTGRRPYALTGNRVASIDVPAGRLVRKDEPGDAGLEIADGWISFE